MIPRYLHTVLQDSLHDFPVVLLTGARQVGKSTLAQALAGPGWPARYLTMDDRAVLDAALLNPDGFIQSQAAPLILDEVQRAPDLLRAIKLVVDRKRHNGGYLLTGSANLLTLATVAETLAGRVAVHDLHPFSWAELGALPRKYAIDDLFSTTSAHDLLGKWPGSAQDGRMQQLQRFLLHGGYPTPAQMQRNASRRTWFECYRQTYLERDLRDLADITHLPDFSRLLATLALRTGQLLNFSALSRDIGLPLSTLRRYFHLLEQTYQVFTIPPYHANAGKRLVKTPKLYLTDTGMSCHLTLADDWNTLVHRGQEGALVETWVAGELRKLTSWNTRRTELSFWRTSAGQEVDFLLERAGQVIGIEVKLASRVNQADLAGLRGCRLALGKSWRLGVLLYGGSHTLALEHDLLAVPFSVFFGLEG